MENCGKKCSSFISVSNVYMRGGKKKKCKKNTHTQKRTNVFSCSLSLASNMAYIPFPLANLKSERQKSENEIHWFLHNAFGIFFFLPRYAVRHECMCVCVCGCVYIPILYSIELSSSLISFLHYFMCYCFFAFFLIIRSQRLTTSYHIRVDLEKKIQVNFGEALFLFWI